MNLTALLDKIAGRQEERQQAHEADFHQLVVEIADGQEPDADELEHVLACSGKTIDDLRKAVELLEHRRNLKSTADRASEFEKERASIESEIAKADRIFNEADAKHESTVDPLLLRLRQLKMLTKEAEKARRELWNTCRDEDLVAQLDEVSRELAKVSRQLSETETKARNHRQTAAYEYEQAKFAKKKPDVEQHRKSAVMFEDNAHQMEVQLPALRTQVAKLEKQEREIREKMLVP